MSVHSVPCWRWLDKAGRPLACLDACRRLMAPPTACRLMSAPYDLMAPWTFVLRLYHDAQALSAPLGSPLFLEMSGAVSLQIQLFSDLARSRRRFNRVRAFGRSGAHIREKSPLSWGMSPGRFAPQMAFKTVLMANAPSSRMSAHFREKWCALSGEVVRTFGRSKYR